jgi:hypothetical protein
MLCVYIIQAVTFKEKNSKTDEGTGRAASGLDDSGAND